MTETDQRRLEQKLIEQRREIFRCRQVLEGQWQELGEREIELEEEAQKANLAELFDQLDEREKKEIEEIDLALGKMAAGTFGICEHCEKEIPLKRLESLPAARLCISCAAKEETKLKIPPAGV